MTDNGICTFCDRYASRLLIRMGDDKQVPVCRKCYRIALREISPFYAAQPGEQRLYFEKRRRRNR